MAIAAQTDRFILVLSPKFTAAERYASVLDKAIQQLAAIDAEELRLIEFSDEMEEGIAWDEHCSLYGEVSKALRYSCVVALMTAVDTALMAICEELRRRGGIKLPVSALRGSDRQKAMVYLKKVVGMTPPSGWFGSRLSHLGAIRNCIVHQDGHVAATRDPEALQKHIQAMRGFSASNGVVTIAPGTCEELASKAVEWWFELCQAAGFKRLGQTE
jgi:uncharacterized protein YutE (UPF0331/DUF86 family)